MGEGDSIQSESDGTSILTLNDECDSLMNESYSIKTKSTMIYSDFDVPPNDINTNTSKNNIIIPWQGPPPYPPLSIIHQPFENKRIKKQIKEMKDTKLKILNKGI